MPTKRKDRSDFDSLTMNDEKAIPSQTDLLTTAKSDWNALLRVSHRLALVDTSEKLQTVLDKLLPRLLRRIGDNHALQQSYCTSDPAVSQAYQQIHTTLVEMLSHTMKRVKDDDKVQLPCESILQLLFRDPQTTPQNPPIPMSNLANVDAFTLNLSLAFLSVGLPRMTEPKYIEALLPPLLMAFSESRQRLFKSASTSQSQFAQMKNLLIVALERMAATGPWLSNFTSASSGATAQTPSQTLLTAKIPTTQLKSPQEPLNSTTNQDSYTYWDLVHIIMNQRTDVSSAVYDTLLDVLLYQPPTTTSAPQPAQTTSGIPPAGLSQVGAESLPTALVRDRSRLLKLKMTLLDWIAPHKRRALFLASATISHYPMDEASRHLNVSRTVALLVVATGDPVASVSEKASAFLKQHLDALRGSELEKFDERNDRVGLTLALALELLGLCLGQVHADSLVPHSLSVHRLGLDATLDTKATHQQVLSTKRRPVDEATVGAGLTSFVGSKIFLEYPSLFDHCDQAALANLAALAVQVASRSLSSAGGTSGNMTKLRAKPYMMAGELLSALSIRLATYYDSGHPVSAVEELLARCMSTACTVLKSFASRCNTSSADRAVSGSNDGSVAVRDSCYGVVATLSRSQLCNSRSIFLFNCGIASKEARLDSSVETASLLFQCTACEEERLRPRAVAALDSLLAAYCRACIAIPVVKAQYKEDSLDTGVGVDVKYSSNPWLSTPTTVPEPLLPVAERDSLRVDGTGLANALLPLLWNAAHNFQPKASRLAAARWASDLLKELDLVCGYHLLCFLAGDPDSSSASIAREGLGLSKLSEISHESALTSVPADFVPGTLPDFGTFVDKMFKLDTPIAGRQLHYWDFPLKGKAATLRFSLRCLSNDLYGGENKAVATYLSTILKTLQEIPGDTTVASASPAAQGGGTFIDLLDECAACLLVTLTTSSFARDELSRRDTACSLPCSVGDIESFAIRSSSSKARRYFASACGQVLENSLPHGAGETFDSFLEWIDRSNLLNSLTMCSQSLREVELQHATPSALHGSAFLGAHLVRAFRLRSAHVRIIRDSKSVDGLWSYVSNVLTLLGKGLQHRDDIVANACADSLAIALSFESPDAPFLDERLYECSTSVLNQLAAGLSLFGHSDTVNPTRTTKIARAAGVILAATTAGADNGNNDIGLGRMACVDALFQLLGSMASRKEEELALVVGEALADYADGYSPENVVWTNSGKIWPSEFDERFAKGLPPHEQVLYVLLRRLYPSSDPHKKIACAPALLAVVAMGARRVNMDVAASQRCLIQSLASHLEEIQKAFLALLADPKGKHFARESSCLGLVACRGLVNEQYNLNLRSGFSVDELNHKLLRAFGQTTNFGGSAMMETQAQAAARRAAQGMGDNEAPEAVITEVGGASGIGEAALGAYREMAAVSVSLEKYDIIYALFFLSLSHSFWLSPEAKRRYSVLSLLGESLGGKSAVEFRQALRPYLGRLLPRILRACHDPNKQTRDQVSALWIGITGGGAEGRQAISTHLMSTIDILLEDTSSKIWRARVGACGALSEILVGCSWSALGGGGPVLNDDELIGKVASSAGIRILRIWNAVVRALDDVQGAVRDCGERLGRATRALSVRLCDPSRDSKLHASVRDSTVENENHAREATAAAATILRWLIRHGLDQTCAEATELCLSTLVDVVGVVRPTILEPSLPALLKSLLLAISALEPALFNNLQLRMDDKEQLERARLQIAQEGQLSVALTKCIELVPFVKLQTQKSIATELDAALRQSVGFATRAAIADAVSTLCRTCPAVFLFPGPNSTNPSVHLLRALYSASEQERGEAAKDKMVHALGNLASHCPPSSVRSLCVRACKKYVSSSGNNFDSASRRTASASLRAIALRASSHFGDGGPGDVWATRILPIAYIGRKDIDSKVSSMWQVVWDEGGSAAGLSGSSSNINSFGTTMEEKLLPSLVQECVLALHDVSWARRAAGSQALIDLVEMGILAPPPRSTQAPTSQGKSDVSRARVIAEASALALRECIYLLVKPRLWSGKVEVMKAAAIIVSKWTAAIASNDSLFGWNDNEHSCPYYPFVIVRDVSDINDLFAGDGWFTRSSAESDFLLEGVSRSPLREDSIETDQCEDLIEADQLVFRSNLSFENDYGDEVETTVETKTDESGQSRTADLSFAGLCRFLIDQAIPQQKDVSAASSTDLLLPYRNSAFRCFRDVISSLPPECLDQRIVIFKCLSPALVATFGRSNQDAALSARESPVLVAAAINCFESCLWAGIGSPQDHVVHTDVHELTKLLQEVGGTLQPAWTVREAAVKCVAQLALKCCDDSIRRPVVVSEMIAVARTALADRKFWRVRFAGLQLIENLVFRGGRKDASIDMQLNLEALLPHKEVILRLTRSCLSDSESSIIALSSSVVTSMAWWP